MSIYKCAKCGCKENTALGLYWMRRYTELYDWSDVGEQYKGLPLCSECAPSHFSNGEPTGWGKWHGKFKKEL